jgi:uncharacterized protein (TIGR00725 family)
MAVVARCIVAVAAPDRAGPMVLEVAREVGRAIISRGFHVLVGGVTPVLAACCEGAQEEKTNLRRRGKFVGDAPSVMAMLPGDARPDPSGELDMVLPTGLGAAVHSVVCASCDALIALDGGANTLAHVAMAWNLGKTLVLLSPNGSALEHMVGERFDQAREDMIMAADTAERALDMIAQKLNAAPAPRIRR